MGIFLIKYRKIITPVLLMLGCFLIFFNFTTTPKVWVDEGVFTETAKNLAFHGVLGLQTSPGEYFPMKGFLLSTSYPVIFPVATSFYLFGLGIIQARVPMLLYMLCFMLIVYLFVEKKYGYTAAIFSILTIVSFSPFYGNGRPVQGEIPGLFFFMLGVYGLLMLERNKFLSVTWASIAGVALGLSMATKPLFLVVVGISVVCGLLLWFKQIQDKKVLWACICGLAIPLVIWTVIHFPNIHIIKNNLHTLLYLSGNHNSSISTTATILHNIVRFVTEATPVLFLLLASVSLVSIAYRTNKERDITLAEFIIVCFIVLNWVLYLRGTGWYRYFFPAHMLLYVLFPASILYMSGKIRNTLLKKMTQLTPLFIIVFQFYHLIFLSDTSFVVQRTRNTQLDSALGSIGPTKKVLLYNSIEAGVFLKSFRYSQYLKMDDFLIAGDQNVIKNTDADFILTDVSQGDNVALSCYTESRLSQYYFLEKRQGCK